MFVCIGVSMCVLIFYYEKGRVAYSSIRRCSSAACISVFETLVLSSRIPRSTTVILFPSSCVILSTLMNLITYNEVVMYQQRYQKQ